MSRSFEGEHFNQAFEQTEILQQIRDLLDNNRGIAIAMPPPPMYGIWDSSHAGWMLRSANDLQIFMDVRKGVCIAQMKAWGLHYAEVREIGPDGLPVEEAEAAVTPLYAVGQRVALSRQSQRTGVVLASAPYPAPNKKIVTEYYVRWDDAPEDQSTLYDADLTAVTP